MSNLAIARIESTEGETTKWIVFLHGILGSGANWRTFAKQLIATQPGLGAMLVDIRLHGDSLEGFDPPHTIEAAARDIVIALGEEIKNVRIVLGHSFGGKVAMEFVSQVAQMHPGELPVEHLIIVDSTPGPRSAPEYRGSSMVIQIVDLLMNLPTEFPDRASFTAWVEERGVSRPIAMWLAMNVRPITNTTRFAFRIDVPSVRAMMDDYFARDLWPFLENLPDNNNNHTMRVHIIAGGKSDVLSEEDLERARRCWRTNVDVVPDAGHWVHVDAPDALRSLVLRYLDDYFPRQ